MHCLLPGRAPSKHSWGSLCGEAGVEGCERQEIKGKPVRSCELAGGRMCSKSVIYLKNRPQNETPETLQASVVLRNLIIRPSLFFVFLECYKSSFVHGLSSPRNMHLWIFLLEALPKLVSRSSVRPKRDRLGGVFYAYNHLPLSIFPALPGPFLCSLLHKGDVVFLSIISTASPRGIHVLLEQT